MRIDENALKCVAFLQYKMADDSMRYVGTCFFITINMNKTPRALVVTARHVIDGVKKLGLDEIFVRCNLRNGETKSIPVKLEKWIYSTDKSIDISAAGFAPINGADHLYFQDSCIMTDEIIKAHEINRGDEVIITGLFKHHPGESRNSPIIRVGNIALMPEEEIKVKFGNGSMDAYLIESRSIGGLSGSPVFVNLGTTRNIQGETRLAQGALVPPLFGIVHGHFDSKENDIDHVENETHEQEKMNTGIAIITPASKLIKFLEEIKSKDLKSNKN